MDPSNLSCAHHSIDFVTDIDSVEEKVARTDRVTLHSDAAVKSNVIPLLPPGLDLTASGLKAQIALVDGLVEQVAILDRNWTLLALNRAWTKATMAGASPELRLGLNYLKHCEQLASEGDGQARAAVTALRSIDSGDIDRFEYRDDGEGVRSERTDRVRLFSCGERRQWRIMVRYDVSELVALKQQTKHFAGQLLHAEAEERRRVARDLHDTTAQDLIALQLTLANLKRGRGSVFRDKLADADEALDRLQREIRSISYLFHSPTPDQLSLSKDLEKLAKGFGQRTGLDVTLWLDDTDVLDRKLCMMVHRLTQEALANIHRHAAASEVEIRLIITDQRLHLMIKDNGIGFRTGSNAAESAGVGLKSMAERVEELGGRLVITSGSDGTSIIASLPFRDEGRLESFA
ncbi:MAG: sensor histidine kinase [Allosphingosinicella sp.]